MAEEKILLVDDDADIREIITLYLQNERYNVITAEDGSKAVSMALSEQPDLIILDMMLPVMDGIEVCQELRKSLKTPIIFLSCKSSATEKSLGLIAGGDDYMGKPFEPIELIARIKAHLRRNNMNNNELLSSSGVKASTITYAGLTIDIGNYCVTVNGEDIPLPPKELQILALLAQNPNTVISSEQLFRDLWGVESFGDYRTIMVHISNLRKKIEADPKNPEFIQTIKGVGYKFNAPN
ncbi:MAG: response regulator transcription factor [Ruminiclostridium sp.]|nr:response regulator transcription factor [Ruminiclostridium sp.]